MQLCKLSKQADQAFAACRQLANLGTKACQEQWAVEPFNEEHRDIHDFAKRVGRLPEQRDGDEVDYRGLLHRDGSVISAVTLEVSESCSAEMSLLLVCPAIAAACLSRERATKWTTKASNMAEPSLLSLWR